MTQSIEDHAAIRVSGRLTVPPECLCDEYAHLITEQAKEIKDLKKHLKYYIKAYLELLEEQRCKSDLTTQK